MSYMKSPLLILFSRMDVWKNKEKSLKSPWKCTSKVLEKSLKKVCHNLWEPCISVWSVWPIFHTAKILRFLRLLNWGISEVKCHLRITLLTFCLSSYVFVGVTHVPRTPLNALVAESVYLILVALVVNVTEFQMIMVIEVKGGKYIVVL